MEHSHKPNPRKVLLYCPLRKDMCKYEKCAIFNGKVCALSKIGEK